MFELPTPLLAEVADKEIPASWFLAAGVVLGAVIVGTHRRAPAVSFLSLLLASAINWICIDDLRSEHGRFLAQEIGWVPAIFPLALFDFVAIAAGGVLVHCRVRAARS